MPLDRCRSEIREKIIAIHQELPGRLIARIGQIELPRHKADLLAAMGVAGEASGLVGQRSGLDRVAVRRFVLLIPLQEELSPGVPEFALQDAL